MTNAELACDLGILMRELWDDIEKIDREGVPCWEGGSREGDATYEALDGFMSRAAELKTDLPGAGNTWAQNHIGRDLDEFLTELGNCSTYEAMEEICTQASDPGVRQRFAAFKALVEQAADRREPFNVTPPGYPHFSYRDTLGL